jgi:hypothetical protein
LPSCTSEPLLRHSCMYVCTYVCVYADTQTGLHGRLASEETRGSAPVVPWSKRPFLGKSIPRRREVHEKSAECWLAALERARDCLLLLVLARSACALQRDIQGRYDGGPKASAYRARIFKDSLGWATIDRATSCHTMALRCDSHAPEWLPFCRGEHMHG